jgi:glutamine synthetase
VKWETYTKKLQIEARVLGDLVMNHVIPVATKYQSALLDNVYKIHQVYDKDKATTLSAHDTALIEEISERIAFIKTKTEELVEARKVANRIDDERAKAIAYHDKVAPYFDEIRYHVDKLELLVDDELWTLPKYRELLFVR